MKESQKVKEGKAFSVTSFKFIIHKVQRELNTNHDGTVTEEELIEILCAFGMDRHRAFEEAHTFFEYNDVTNSGKVLVDEFCEEYIRRQQFKLINRIRKMFQKLDADGSNSLEKEEIVQVLVEEGGNHHEAVEQVNIIFGEVDKNGDGSLSFKELQDWYVRSALRSKQQREKAIAARRKYRVDKHKLDRSRAPSRHANNMEHIAKNFACKFYPVLKMSAERKQQEFQSDLLVMNLSDVADAKTEIPVIASIFGSSYEIICHVFTYYSSLNFLSGVTEVGCLHMDQIKHMMQDARLLIKSWDVEEEFIMMKKMKSVSAGVDKLAFVGMNQGQFMEFLVRVAKMHQRKFQKSKLDLTQWLLEILQAHLRDNALKPLSEELKLRTRLQLDSVQEVYSKYIRKLWKVYHKHALNVEDSKIQTPLTLTGLLKLLKTCFTDVNFTKRDFVHWFVMSREDTGDRNSMRRSKMVNGSDVYWNEYLEILARLAVHNDSKSDVASALNKIFSTAQF